MGFRTPNFQQFQQPQQQKQFQDQDQDLQPVGKRQKGTGFTNIGKILGANVGAGERMGRQVGQAVGMQAGQAQAGVTQAQRQFQTAKTEAEQKAKSALGGVGQYLDNTAGLAGMSEEEAKKAREVFTKEGQYTGPKGLEQESQLKARAEALGDVATMGMSGRGGRQQLARSIVAGPGMYTRGQSLLDATLLGQSGAAQRAIEAGSRQALGVQQEIGKTALSAQQQAKIAESALSKEKEAIGKKVGEKFEEVGTEGEKAAQQFADDINRFKQLLTAEKSTDKDGNVIYKDPVTKNIINVTDRDRELVSNPEQFGLSGSIELDRSLDQINQEYADLTKGILGDIASQGAFAYQKGMKRYTPEQEAIARNLALLKGETPQEYSPFETDVFKIGKENIEEKSQSYRKLRENLKTEQENIEKGTKIDQWLNEMKRLAARGEFAPGWGRFLQLSDIWAKYLGLDPNEVRGELKKSERVGWVNHFENLSKGLKKYENELQNRQTVSLKDYLANLYKRQEQ